MNFQGILMKMNSDTHDHIYIYTYVCVCVMNRLYSVDNEIKWLFRANFSPVCMVYGADVLRCQNYWALNADVPENCTCLLDGFDDSILVCFSKMVRTTLIYILYLPFRSILQPQRKSHHWLNSGSHEVLP